MDLRGLPGPVSGNIPDVRSHGRRENVTASPVPVQASKEQTASGSVPVAGFSNRPGLGLRLGPGPGLASGICASVNRILRRTKENYESNALTKEAYTANKKKFEPVDLDDLKQRHPNLEVIHLTVDTEHDEPENWYIIGKTVK